MTRLDLTNIGKVASRLDQYREGRFSRPQTRHRRSPMPMEARNRPKRRQWPWENPKGEEPVLHLSLSLDPPRPRFPLSHASLRFDRIPIVFTSFVWLDRNVLTSFKRFYLPHSSTSLPQSTRHQNPTGHGLPGQLRFCCLLGSSRTDADLCFHDRPSNLDALMLNPIW